MPIVSDPKVMMGEPTSSGARIQVEPILERLAAGEAREQIREGSPRLAPEHIRTALGFSTLARKGSPPSRN